MVKQPSPFKLQMPLLKFRIWERDHQIEVPVHFVCNRFRRVLAFSLSDRYQDAILPNGETDYPIIWFPVRGCFSDTSPFEENPTRFRTSTERREMPA